jgi:hypothetical protein
MAFILNAIFLNHWKVKKPPFEECYTRLILVKRALDRRQLNLLTRFPGITKTSKF